MLLPFVKRINTTIKLSFWIKVPIIYLIFAIKEVFFLRMSFKFVNQAHNLGDQLIFKKFHRYLKLQIQYFEFLRTLGRNICLFSPVPTLQLSVWIPEDLLLLHRTPLGRSNSRSLRKTATAGATKRQSNKSIKGLCKNGVRQFRPWPKKMDEKSLDWGQRNSINKHEHPFLC